MNLLQKLSMQKESVEDWRQLVESIYIDWNYDGQTMRPTIRDIPAKDELVSGIYKIPCLLYTSISQRMCLVMIMRRCMQSILIGNICMGI